MFRDCKCPLHCKVRTPDINGESPWRAEEALNASRKACVCEPVHLPRTTWASSRARFLRVLAHLTKGAAQGAMRGLFPDVGGLSSRPGVGRSTKTNVCPAQSTGHAENAFTLRTVSAKRGTFVRCTRCARMQLSMPAAPCTFGSGSQTLRQCEAVVHNSAKRRCRQGDCQQPRHCTAADGPNEPLAGAC